MERARMAPTEWKDVKGWGYMSSWEGGAVSGLIC